jgi:hypothetical protein
MHRPQSPLSAISSRKAAIWSLPLPGNQAIRNLKKGCPVNITEITRVSLRNGYEHGFSYGSCDKRGFTNAPIADCRLTLPKTTAWKSSRSGAPLWFRRASTQPSVALVTLPARPNPP